MDKPVKHVLHTINIYPLKAFKGSITSVNHKVLQSLTKPYNILLSLFSE